MSVSFRIYVYLYVFLWKELDNLAETRFNLDWWGIWQFLEAAENNPKDKFNNPEFFEPKTQNGDLPPVYKFINPSPVFSAVQSPTILFIGNDSDYNLFYRSLAYDNINSRLLIPAHKNRYIDDYSLNDLSFFDALVLYGYQYKNKNKAETLLNEYLKRGGAIYVEEKEYSPDLTEVLPVKGIISSEFGTKWEIDKTDDSQFLEDIDFKKFSPAVFEKNPWKLAYASELDNWGKPILKQQGKTILATGQLVDGKIVWSGMNLIYHIVNYKNQEESKMLGKILFWLAGKPKETVNYPIINDSLIYSTPDFEAEFVNPQKRILRIKNEQVTGVLLKEFYFPGWRAYLNGKRTNLYKAGPDFMFVPLKSVSPGDEVVLRFQINKVSLLGLVISVISFLFVIVYLLGVRIKLNFFSLPFIKDINFWWNQDSDY